MAFCLQYYAARALLPCSSAQTLVATRKSPYNLVSNLVLEKDMALVTNPSPKVDQMETLELKLSGGDFRPGKQALA